MSDTHYWEVYRELPDGTEEKVTIEFEASPFVPAYTSGLPEDCYPEEGGEIEIVVCHTAALDWEATWTAAEAEKWETDIRENWDPRGR